jgi:hypothetical protein
MRPFTFSANGSMAMYVKGRRASPAAAAYTPGRASTESPNRRRR